MFEKFLFGIPAEFALQHDVGSVMRYGSILKDVKTGRIVAHLAETGAFQDAVSSVLSSGGNPVSMLTGVAGVVQNQQIKGKLDALQSLMGTMQMTQIATLVSSVAGIGVTAISTAILMRRIEAVRTEVAGIGGRIDGLAKELSAKDLRRELADLKTALERLDSLGHRRDAESVAKDVEKDLHGLNGRFGEEMAHHAAQPKLDVEVIATLTASFSLSGTALVNALLWCDEMAEAERAATRQARTFAHLSQVLPGDRLLEAGGASAEGLSLTLRELYARAATQPSLLRRVHAAEISGRAWLDMVRERDDAPLLVLQEAA